MAAASAAVAVATAAVAAVATAAVVAAAAVVMAAAVAVAVTIVADASVATERSSPQSISKAASFAGCRFFVSGNRCEIANRERRGDPLHLGIRKNSIIHDDLVDHQSRLRAAEPGLDGIRGRQRWQGGRAVGTRDLGRMRERGEDFSRRHGRAAG